MGKKLFVCYTPYQIFVSVWLKYHYFNAENADIVINNKLKNYENIANNIKQTELFNKVIIWDDVSKKSKLGKIIRIKNEYLFAKELISKNEYIELFTANFDFFVGRIFDFGKRKNINFKFNYYEDGIGSYSKKCESFYRLFDHIKKDNISHNNFAVKYHIHGNINNFYVFTPELMEWDPQAKSIIGIDAVDKFDNDFKNIVNSIFSYETLEDSYDRKYIFFEESYYQDTGYMEDVDLIENLAETIGKDNMMIKIHPRNRENRFETSGYKTNKNTIIPWEVLALNMDLDHTILITIASSSVVNPIAIFGCKAKTYSLLNCINEKPYQLNSTYSKTVLNFFNYFDNIIICNSIGEIENEV